MKLNDIWGYGQLFGFSAFDGPNRYYEDNILMLMENKLEFRFEYRPYYLLMYFPKLTNINFKYVMGDFVVAKTGKNQNLFYLTFIDNDTLVGLSDSLPCFKGEKPIKKSKEREVDVVQIENHSLGIRYKKVNDQYLFVVHNSFTPSEARSGANYFIDHVDINAIIKSKINYYKKMPKCIDAKYEQLYYKSLSVNKVNTHSAEGKILDFWTTPDRVPHRHMWLWDSVFHSMAMVHYNKKAAKTSLFSMLSQMREDGFLSHMANPTDCSDVTQPCVMSYGVWYLYQYDKDKNFLKKCVPYLEKYLNYDIENRED